MHVLKANPRTVHKARTQAQLRTTNAFRTCTRFWSTHQATIDQAFWRDYADRHPRISRSGVQFIMSPYLAFMSHNLYRTRSGLPVSADPPTD